jgi:hypothetical protein
MGRSRSRSQLFEFYLLPHKSVENDIYIKFFLNRKTLRLRIITHAHTHTHAPVRRHITAFTGSQQ